MPNRANDLLRMAWVVLTLLGCEGQVIGPRERGPGQTQPPDPTALTRVKHACTTPAVGSWPMKRLTHGEYDNALRDLLGDTSAPAQHFIKDNYLDTFEGFAKSQSVSELLAESYVDTAASVAERIPDIAGLLGCAPSRLACVQPWLERFVRRAYRRPPTADERSALLGIYADTTAQADAEVGVRAVVAAVLVSPNFLFQPEFGASGGTVPGATPVSAYELAGRLAKLIWASVPDDTLLDAAAAGGLSQRADVEAQARRMLKDPRADTGLVHFYLQWMGLNRIGDTVKSATVYPDWNDALSAAMVEETRRFVTGVLDGDASLATLFSSPTSYVNPALAKLYGLGAPTTGDTFTRVTLDPTQRAGLLTRAGVMALYGRTDQSAPIKRGKWVRERVLCQDMQLPKDVPAFPAIDPSLTNRQRFEQHTSNPACAGCHSLIDGVGFGLETYDGIGQYRILDSGKPVDASGNIVSTVDANGRYSGGVELSQKLGQSAQVRDCVSVQWLRYTLGRRETADDECALATLQTTMDSSGGDLRELIVALTGADAFWNYRQD